MPAVANDGDGDSGDEGSSRRRMEDDSGQSAQKIGPEAEANFRKTSGMRRR